MDINQKIKDLIKKNNVCLFMKGTPDSPQCGFSMTVSNILKHLNVNFQGVNVLDDENLRQGIKTFSDWPTIPQLYVKEEFIGGCDIVKEMFEKGELKKLLENEDIIIFKVSLKLKYNLPDNSLAKYLLIAPTGFAMDISLSFRITINFDFSAPALFISS